MGSRHRDPDACVGEHGLQRLLQRSGSPERWDTLPRGREPELGAGRDRPDTHVQPPDERVEPWPEHGRGALVSDGHATAQRRDADHRGRPRRPRGSYHGREPAAAEYGVAEPPAVSVDRRGAERTSVLLRSRPDDAGARHERHRGVAELRPARPHRPQLRRPRALRCGQDPRRRRRRLERGRPRREHQRSDAAGDRYRADGERAPSAQPHRPGRRDGPGDGRQLLRPVARGPQQRRLCGRALESGDRYLEDAGRRTGDPPVPLHRATAARRARAVLRGWHLRYVRPGRLPRQERAGLYAALPVQAGRLGRARAAPGDHRRARHHRSRHELPDRHPGRRLDPQGRARPPRRRHALGQHGAALRAAVLHRRSRRADRDRARERRHRPARRLHAVHH